MFFQFSLQSPIAMAMAIGIAIGIACDEPLYK